MILYEVMNDEICVTPIQVMAKKNSGNNFADIKICARNIESLTADKLTDDILEIFYWVFISCY